MATYGPYRARVVSLHDGDTVSLDLDLGFDIVMRAHDFDGHPSLSCRVYGINAPELSTPEGVAALDFAETLLKPGDLVTVLSHGWDKYGGRFLGSITMADTTDFGTRMVESGHAVPYGGGAKDTTGVAGESPPAEG